MEPNLNKYRVTVDKWFSTWTIRFSTLPPIASNALAVCSSNSVALIVSRTIRGWWYSKSRILRSTGNASLLLGTIPGVGTLTALSCFVGSNWIWRCAIDCIRFIWYLAASLPYAAIELNGRPTSKQPFSLSRVSYAYNGIPCVFSSTCSSFISSVLVDSVLVFESSLASSGLLSVVTVTKPPSPIAVFWTFFWASFWATSSLGFSSTVLVVSVFVLDSVLFLLAWEVFLTSVASLTDVSSCVLAFKLEPNAHSGTWLYTEIISGYTGAQYVLPFASFCIL